MNVFCAVGNLSKEPELRYSSGGKAICNFSLAINRIFKRDGEPDVDFFDVTCFGKTAEYVSRFLHKGGKVSIVGRLQNDQWEKDGVKKYRTKVLAESVQGLEKKPQGDSSGGNSAPADSGQYDAPNPRPGAPIHEAYASAGIQDDEDPFAE